MMINAISPSFCAKLPKKLPDKMPKIPKVKEEPLPDFFRDNELFDSKKDKLTIDYYRYDVHDFDVHVPKHDPLYDLYK